MGLNPAYTPLVYAQNPVDLNAAVEAARTVEVGYNFATGVSPKMIESTLISTPAKEKPSNDVDDLTRKMEQLSINYANLTSRAPNGSTRTFMLHK